MGCVWRGGSDVPDRGDGGLHHHRELDAQLARHPASPLETESQIQPVSSGFTENAPVRSEEAQDVWLRPCEGRAVVSRDLRASSAVLKHERGC